MFKKSNRLGKTTDVQRVFTKGRAFFNPLFTVKFLAQPQQSARFTVVVSTKVAKSAVKRNRIKRVLREFVRLNLSKFQPGDYVIMVKPVAAIKHADEWRAGLEGVVRKGHLYG